MARNKKLSELNLIVHSNQIGGKMKVKTAVLWWLVNDKEHESLWWYEKTIEQLLPLLSSLFPGIKYNCTMLELDKFMKNRVIPLLKKRYPELLTTPAENIKSMAVTEVVTALPTEGDAWKDSTSWESEFRKLLVAT